MHTMSRESAVDDEISLLDLLVTIAEHWLLLVVVPILAGLAAYAFAAQQTGTWRSSAAVGLPQAEVSRYLQTVFDEEGALAGTGVPVSDIERGLVLSKGSTDGRTRIELSLPGPETAERALEAVLARLSAAVESGGIVRPQVQIEAEIAVLAQEISLRERMIATLTRTIEESEAAASFDATIYASAASTLNEIMNARDQQQARRTLLMNNLAALPVDVIEQDASSGARVGQSPLTIALLVFVGTGVVLLILIFIRAGLRNAAADPETRDKIDRIRRAFWLAPRRR